MELGYQKAFDEVVKKPLSDGGKPKKHNVYDAVAPKGDVHTVLQGVYHTKSGYGVASDGYILIKSKAAYDKTKKGKIVGKDGKEIEGTYVKFDSVIPNSAPTQEVDFDRLADFLASVRKTVGNAKKFADTKVIVRVPDGRIAIYNASQLESLVAWARATGGKGIEFTAIDSPLVVRTSDGVGMVMPIYGYGIANGDIEKAYGIDLAHAEQKKKTAESERSGAVSGTTSSNSLNQNGEVHLSRSTSTQTDLNAKLRENFKRIKSKVQKFINEGFTSKNAKDAKTQDDIVRALSDAFGFKRSQSSNSFYGEFEVEGEFENNGKKYKVRISTHPANGENMSKGDFDERISIVVHKNGEHKVDGDKPYTEWTYRIEGDNQQKIIENITRAVNSVLNGKEYTAGGNPQRVIYNSIHESLTKLGLKPIKSVADLEKNVENLIKNFDKDKAFVVAGKTLPKSAAFQVHQYLWMEANTYGHGRLVSEFLKNNGIETTSNGDTKSDLSEWVEKKFGEVRDNAERQAVTSEPHTANETEAQQLATEAVLEALNGVPGIEVVMEEDGAEPEGGSELNTPQAERMTVTSSDIFYSPAMKALDGIKQEKATGDQWIAMLQKAGGLKAEEDKWIGLSDFLKGKKSVTKQEIQDFIRENQVQVEEVKYGTNNSGYSERELRNYESDLQRYLAQGASIEDVLKALDNEFGGHLEEDYKNGRLHIAEDGTITTPSSYDKGINSTRLSYTTKGLKKRREIALTVPTIEPYRELDEIHFGDAGEGRAVAWVRFGETTDKDGKRVLVIDEVQSKRHQDGREKGYANEAEIAQTEARLKDLEEQLKNEGIVVENDNLNGLVSFLDSNGNSVTFFNAPSEKVSELMDEFIGERSSILEEKTRRIPNAPFQKNWHELAMKRMLRYAAENGYDKVAWTTGKQQAERYNIGKQVDEIRVYDMYDGQHDVRGYKGGQAVFTQTTIDGEKGLAELLGKDMARKAYSNLHEGKEDYMQDGHVSLTGDNLMIGGEGMKGFYDQMLPRFMDKYGKKWGVKTGEVELNLPNEADQKMHAVDVTDGMKKSVMEGQPMFLKDTKGVTYGWAVGNEIHLTPAGVNPNTPIHEYTHLWAKAVMKGNPELWQNVKELLKETPVWNEVVNDKAYTDIYNNEDAVASEVLARLSGRKNAEKMERMAQEMIGDARKEGIVATANAITLIERVKEAIGDFWKWVGVNLFKMKNVKSVDEVTDRVLYDLVSGTDLRGTTKSEMDEIKARAQANGTFMKAPNGKPTNLNEKQWLQVRTKAFKKWFGDWELGAKAKMPRKAQSVSDAIELIKPLLGKPIENEQLGMTATISGNSLNKLKSEKATKQSVSPELHAMAVANIDVLFKNAAFDVTHPDRNGDRNIAQIHRLGSLMYDETTGNYVPVKITVKEFTNEENKRIYSVEAVDIEIQKKSAGQMVSGSTKSGRTPIADFNTKLQQLFDTANNSSKVVDENGEPRVVYHGTPYDFNAFDMQKGSGMAMFTTDATLAENFAKKYGDGKVVPVFLNVQNPRETDIDGYDWRGDGVGENKGKSINKGRKFAYDYMEARKAKRDGHDGLMLQNVTERTKGGEVKSTHYIVFNSNQIKSATDNNGEFSEDDNDIRFSKGEKEKREKYPEVAKVGDLLGVAIVPINKRAELPREEKGAMRAIKEGKKVKGWYNPNTGKAYILMSEGMTENDVNRIILHEAIAHKGLRELLGKEKFDELCKNVWEGMTKTERERELRYAWGSMSARQKARALGMDSTEGLNGLNWGDLTDEQKARCAEDAYMQSVAADEHMAHTAEGLQSDKPKPSQKKAWRRIVDAIKTALNNMADALDINAHFDIEGEIERRAEELLKNGDIEGFRKLMQAEQLNTDNLTSLLQWSIAHQRAKARTENNGEPTANDETLYSLLTQNDLNEDGSVKQEVLDEIAKERAEILKNAPRNERGQLLAPNGEVSNLSDGQYTMVRTKRFKEWFGDWEKDPANSSKVVDENGEPKVMYHGTNQGGFVEFDTDGHHKTAGTGAYFGRERDAQTYTKSNDILRDEDFNSYEEFGSDIEGIYACFLNVRNPYEHDFNDGGWDDAYGEKYKVYNEEGDVVFAANNDREAREYISENDGESLTMEEDSYTETIDDMVRDVRKGYMGEDIDGVFAKDVYDGGDDMTITDEWIVFSPNQIKSATDNVGTYSGETGDIRFSEEKKYRLVPFHKAYPTPTIEDYYV